MHSPQEAIHVPRINAERRAHEVGRVPTSPVTALLGSFSLRHLQVMLSSQPPSPTRTAPHAACTHLLLECQPGHNLTVVDEGQLVHFLLGPRQL